MVPNHTAQALQHPDCLVGRFTDDGQRLLCFSRDLQRLLVYRYDGIKTCARGEAPDAPSVLAFDDVFTRQYDVVLAGGAHAIARDFCLLLRDGAFVLLASSAPAGEAPGAAAPQTAADAAVPLLHTATLHVVRLVDGVVCDRRQFAEDFLSLSQNACVSACGDVLTVLALRRQTVYIYRLDAGGILRDVAVVGVHCQPGDKEALLLLAGTPAGGDAGTPSRVIQGIKQRLLTFLFLEAQRSCASRPGVNGCSEAMRPLQLFYRHFEDYLSLLMLRVALVSDSQVAMLLAHPDVTQTFHALQPAFVAIYDFQTARFVAFASCASDDAAGALALASVQLCPLACDSIAARCASNLAPLRLQQPPAASRSSHYIRRSAGCVVAALAPQRPALSPFLDRGLFVFDDKLVSGERPRPCVDYPIKFCTATRQHCVRFHLDTTPQISLEQGRPRWVVSFVFHPTHPFALSVLNSLLHAPQMKLHFRWQ